MRQPWQPRIVRDDDEGLAQPVRRIVDVGGRPRFERAAGVPILTPLGEPPTELPNNCDFSLAGTDLDGAYWMIGRDLFKGTAGEVLRDVRDELLVPDSARLWSLGLVERARDRARSRSPGVTLPELPGPGGGGRLSTAWLKVVLWLAYSDAPVRLDTVRLPILVTAPSLGGAEWPEPYGQVQVYRGFDPTLLSVNPFSRAVLDPIDVTGDPPRRSSTGGGVLVGLAIAGAILGSGN